MEMPAPSASGSRNRNGPGADAQAGAPIDLAHLRRFTLADRALENEILGLFIEQAPATIEKMRQAQSDREWQRAAHTLKGSARAVGAWRIAKLAETAELMGSAREQAACDHLLGQIKAAADEARAHIHALKAAE